MSTVTCSAKNIPLDKVTTVKFDCNKIIPSGVITITKSEYKDCSGCTGLTGCDCKNPCRIKCIPNIGTQYHFEITQLAKQLDQKAGNELVTVANFTIIPLFNGSYGLTANSSNNTAVTIIDPTKISVSVDIGSITFGILRYVIYINNNKVSATVEQTFDAAGVNNSADNIFSCSTCDCLINNPNTINCGNVKVPLVNILGQLNVIGTDMADVIFTICDEFQYYDDIAECTNKCQLYYINQNQVKQTRFHECCLELVSVLKGEGDNLYQKLVYIYNTVNVEVTFDQFYANIIVYALSKYILSRVLYGNFSLKYLLGKYNDKFLKDLGHSRFCGFLELFISCESNVVGYNKYFKVGK